MPPATHSRSDHLRQTRLDPRSGLLVSEDRRLQLLSHHRDGTGAMSGSTRASSPSSKTCAWRSTTRSSALVWTRSPSTGVWPKPPAVVKPPGNHRLTGENKTPNADAFGIPLGCVMADGTATTRSCWNPPWNTWPVSTTTWASAYQSTSRCTWTPATTRTRPANDWPSWAARGASPPRALPCKPTPAGSSNAPTPDTTGAFANC